MVTKNPRLTITLNPSVAAHLRKLSELTGNSQSSIISELLDGTEPVFERMIYVLEAAKGAKEAMRGRFANDIEEAQSRVEGALGIVLEGFDSVTGTFLKEAEAVKRRARRGGNASAAQSPRAALGAASPTPISNRGVRSDPIATKDIAQRRVTVSPEAVKKAPKIRGGK